MSKPRHTQNHSAEGTPCNTTLDPIEIFAPGRRPDMAGQVQDITADDLRATAAVYDPQKHEAPLVIGHPASNAPAYGWAASLSFTETLEANPKDVEPQFAELVNHRRFPKISAAFYAKNSPYNPVPGVLYLRHIGFLGAQPPVVKGLREPTFAENETPDDIVIIEFSQPEAPMPQDPTALAEREAEIAKREAALNQQKADQDAKELSFAERERTLAQAQADAQRTKTVAFAEKLLGEGRILPRDKDGLVAFLTAKTQTDVLEFGEGSDAWKGPANVWLLQFLENLPKQVDYKERAKQEKDDATPPNALEDPLAVSKGITAYREAQEKAGRVITFATAFTEWKAQQEGKQ